MDWKLDSTIEQLGNHFRNALSTFAMLCTRLAPSSASTSRPAARRSRCRRSSRDLVVRAGDKSVKGDEVYVGQGKWNKGDAAKMPGRDGVLTGGWAGGEVGMWQFREEESRQGGKFGPWGDAESVEEAGDDGSRVESITDTDATSSTTTGGNEATKYRLVKVLAALDRGVAASDDDRAFVDDLIDDLERAADVPRDASLEKALDGEWRLAYSSTFAGEQPGSQGFTGAPGQGAPGVSLGAVYQRLNAELKTCDNVVCLRSPLPGIAGTASLGHEYVVDGSGMKISASYTATPGGPGVVSARGVAPREGAALCFPHGDAEDSPVHEGSAVKVGPTGVQHKYIIRTDVLFETGKGLGSNPGRERENTERQT